MIQFPKDIWNEIMSFFHSAYKKPLHLDAISDFVKVFNQTQNNYVVVIVNGRRKYIDNTVYRYILDDYTFSREPLVLYIRKWNPFMSRYCFRSIILNINDSNLRKKWKVNCIYRKHIVTDFQKILKQHYLPSNYYAYNYRE